MYAGTNLYTSGYLSKIFLKVDCTVFLGVESKKQLCLPAQPLSRCFHRDRMDDDRIDDL